MEDLLAALQKIASLDYSDTGKLGEASGKSVAGDTAMKYLPLVGAEFLIILNPKIPIPLPITIPCQFNPEELEFEKRARWLKRYSHGSDVAKPEYSGGAPQEMDLKLFFDTTHLGVSVKWYTFPLLLLTQRLPLINQPTMVLFHWGWNTSQVSYVERVNIKYTFFNPQGMPLRAEVRVKLVEYPMGWLSVVLQNPTTRSEARKTRVVTQGQTLDWIAYEEYGDARHWRHIANANNISNPMKLQPGTILNLTPLP